MKSLYHVSVQNPLKEWFILTEEGFDTEQEAADHIKYCSEMYPDKVFRVELVKPKKYVLKDANGESRGILEFYPREVERLLMILGDNSFILEEHRPNALPIFKEVYQK